MLLFLKNRTKCLPPSQNQVWISSSSILQWLEPYIQSQNYYITERSKNKDSKLFYFQVRVPAVCQYAHKLASLVGQSLHTDPHTVNGFQLQWGSEIRTSLDLEWYKRGKFVNGLDFDSDPDAEPFK